MLTVIAIEGGFPDGGITSGTPALVGGEHLINPLSGDRIPMERLAEYVEDGSLELLTSYQVIDDKYAHADLILLLIEVEKHPLLKTPPNFDPSEFVAVWGDDKWVYVLFPDSETYAKFTEQVITRTIEEYVRPAGAEVDESVMDALLILDFSHPVTLALHVKQALPEYREATERMSIACLRGREDEFYEELRRP